MNSGVKLYVSSGVFWFWDGPWWDHLRFFERYQNIDGIQILCSVEDESQALPPDSISEYIAKRYEIILHPFFSNILPFNKNSLIEMRLNYINSWADKFNVKRIIFHSDLFRSDASSLLLLNNILKEKKILVENTGKRDIYGNCLEHVISHLKMSDDIHLALDIAHLSEVDYEETHRWLINSLIQKRLDCVHVSSHQNGKNRLNLPAEIASANHIPTFLKPDVVDINHRKLLIKYPLIMEGCLPKGRLGEKFMMKEIDFLNSWVYSSEKD
jgi:hypothetical protein